MIKADKGFEVGYSADGKFSMLLIRGTFARGYNHAIGSDGRRYTGIVRVEQFDSTKPEHVEFIPFRDYALRSK
jgi:hypothetical protein